jgi:hypothetical protein
MGKKTIYMAAVQRIVTSSTDSGEPCDPVVLPMMAGPLLLVRMCFTCV